MASRVGALACRGVRLVAARTEPHAAQDTALATAATPADSGGQINRFVLRGVWHRCILLQPGLVARGSLQPRNVGANVPSRSPLARDDQGRVSRSRRAPKQRQIRIVYRLCLLPVLPGVKRRQS